MTFSTALRRPLTGWITRRSTVVTAGVVLLVAVGVGLYSRATEAPRLFGKPVLDNHLRGDFALHDTAGRLVTLASFRGKAVLLAFGYTHCPDVCPTTLARFAEVRRLLGPLAEQLQVVFVTVDPERDTAELLSQYVPAFDPTFIGLRGSEQETDRAAEAFGARYRFVDYGDQTFVEHSASDYLVGPDGRTRAIEPYALTAPQIASDIRAILEH